MVGHWSRSFAHEPDRGSGLASPRGSTFSGDLPAEPPIAGAVDLAQCRQPKSVAWARTPLRSLASLVRVSVRPQLLLEILPQLL